MLVLAAAISLWQALSGKGSWLVYTALMLLTALVHILSYALLLMLSAWVLGYFHLLRECSLPALRRSLAAVALSGAVFIVPGGPYQAMLRDIGTNHILDSDKLLLAVALLAVVLLAALLSLRTRIRSGVLPWFERRLQQARNRPLTFGTAAALTVASVLGVQAAILPPAAWDPYGGSPLRFLVSQTGNLALASLVLVGWVDTITRPAAHPALRALAVLSLGWAGIGAALLVASLFLLDTNWLLRAFNYAILFAAPLAALPLAAIVRRHPWTWGLVAAMTAVSFVLAVRHLAIYGC